VGLIRFGKSPVKMNSLANGGNKIAAAFDGMTVNIWDVETYLVDGNFILEDNISTLVCVTTLDQLVEGNT
jgi:hypothetical protein